VLLVRRLRWAMTPTRAGDRSAWNRDPSGEREERRPSRYEKMPKCMTPRRAGGRQERRTKHDELMTAADRRDNP